MLRCLIKERCEELGVTYKWVSEKSGVPIKTIYDAVRGSNTTIITAIKIANTLGCKLDDLWKMKMP